MDVGDQEAIMEHLTFALEPKHVADRALRAVGDDQPVGMHGVFTVGRADPQRDAVAFLL